MNIFHVFIFCILIFSCSDKKADIVIDNCKTSISLENSVNNFESKLNLNKLKSTFTTSLDSLPYFNEKLKIKTLVSQNNFEIYVNNNKIDTRKIETINDVWCGKDSINYANKISQIKYYEELNLLLLQLDFYPCTGLGCGVNYQLIYDLKNNKTHAFGRFRTGSDMNLYRIEYKNYYLSKTFHGRNAQLKDTIYYELFEIDKLQDLEKNKKIIAEYIYYNENYEKPTSFKLLN